MAQLNDNQLASVSAKLPLLMIVFDDAHNMMHDLNEDASTFAVRQFNKETTMDMYQAVRLTCRLFKFYWDHTLTVTISKHAKCPQVSPPPDPHDPSYRLRALQFRMHTPIILQNTFDVFRKRSLTRESYLDWMEYMFSRERLLDIACCGRPLWGAHIGKWIQGELVRSSIVNDALPYGMSLLKSTRPYNLLTAAELHELFNKLSPMIQLDHAHADYVLANEDHLDDLTAVTLLSLAVAMQKQNVPIDLDTAELVRVGAPSSSTQTAHGMACSEGLFNGAASWMLVKYTRGVVEWLKKLLLHDEHRCRLSVDDVGELVDRMLILHSVFLADRHAVYAQLGMQAVTGIKSICEYLTEPVSLHDFLNVFVGKEATSEYLVGRDELEGAFVAFSHFIYMTDMISGRPYDVAANALSRGAAVVPKQDDGFLFIPLVLKTNGISFVYIHTRVGKSHCGPDQIFYDSPHHRLLGLDDRPYCYVYRVYTVPSDYGHAVLSSDRHDACLYVQGALANINGHYSLQELVDWALQQKRQNDFIASVNASLQRTWTVPVPSQVPLEPYHEYFSLRGVDAEPPLIGREDTCAN